MKGQTSEQGPILRLFQVRARPGCVEELMQKFATTSADVVREVPGNEGYFFGRGVEIDGEFLVFASFWRDLDAVKERFGGEWQSSYLPPGYDPLIEECSIRHLDLSSGWHVNVGE